jgi:hypothetical protein
LRCGSAFGPSFRALRCHREPSVVILSEAKDLALSVFEAARDSSSPSACRNDSDLELICRRGNFAAALEKVCKLLDKFFAGLLHL